MYRVLIISSDSRFLTLAGKFVSHLEPSINLVTGTTIDEAVSLLSESGEIDMILFDHDDVNSIDVMINSMNRRGMQHPILMMSRQTDTKVMIEAIDLRVDAFIERGKSDPMDFFQNLIMKSIVIMERHRIEVGRRVNESRKDAIIQMAKMSDRNFSEILDYALEKSLELTQSVIGYVGLYDSINRKIIMMAWSKNAMKECRVVDSRVEFDIDTTGIWGEPIRLGKSLIVNDYSHNRKLFKNGTPVGHIQLEKLLMIPIFIDGKVVGTAGVANKKLDYTTFDEMQLNTMMNEIFSIYNKQKLIRAWDSENRLVRNLLDLSGTGFIFVSTSMEIIMINKIASSIIDIEFEKGATLYSSESIAAVRLIEILSSLREDDARTRKQIRISVHNKVYDVLISESVGLEFNSSGFLVIFNDVTSSDISDEKIVRMREHIDYLEGAVLKNMMRYSGIIDTIDCSKISDDQKNAIDSISDVVSFMEAYSDIGVSDAEWMYVSDIFSKAKEYADLRDVEFITDFEKMCIYVDPSFFNVFLSMLRLTGKYGTDVSTIWASCRISNGVLTISYKDDGKWNSDFVEHLMLDPDSSERFSYHLVKTLLDTSGFELRNVKSSEGAMLEIDIPPLRYRLG